MPRFTQWEQSPPAEELKRPRVHAHEPLLEQYRYGGYGFDCTQPPDEQQSPELGVEMPLPLPPMPAPAAPDIVHELSQRVELGAGGTTSAALVYDEIHARLARLERLDDASVGKALSKGELLCLLTNNGIASCRHSTHKGAIVAELLLALKQQRIGATLADAQARALARANAEEEEGGTLPPDEELGAAAPNAPTQAPTAGPAVPAPAAAGPAAHVPVAVPARRRAPMPPVSLTAEEEDFVWRLLTGTLGEPIGADGSFASRSVQTQTEPAPPAAGGFAAGAGLASGSQLQQSQAYCSNGGGGSTGRDVVSEGLLIGGVRRQLKSAKQLTDDEIRDALAASGDNVVLAMASLRAKTSTQGAQGLAAAHENDSGHANLTQVWGARLARGSL